MDLKHAPDAPPAAARTAELGYGPMDAVHAELDALLAEAARAADAALPPLLERVAAHLRAHFEAEDRWMRDTAFPPGDCHIDEHAAVLNSCEQVGALVRAGDLSQVRPFLDELARWFPGHADYLDSALAAWMCKRQYGGKPVVVHRRAPAGRADGAPG